MTVLISLAVALAIGWNLGGWHFVHEPTPAQIFGCEHTYINANGEDTGECR